MNETEKRIALVTGADRGLGYCLAKELLEKGFIVYAGKFNNEYMLLEKLQETNPDLHIVTLDTSSEADIKALPETLMKEIDHLDLLVSNAAIMGGSPHDQVKGFDPIAFDEMEYFFKTNSIAGIMLVDALLPLLRNSDYKRLFFTSSEISSVRLMRRENATRYAMSKTALNLGVRMVFNTLRPEGFKIRLFQPGWMKRMAPDGSLAAQAIVDPADSAREAVRQILEDRLDEDVLTLTDYLGRALSF